MEKGLISGVIALLVILILGIASLFAFEIFYSSSEENTQKSLEEYAENKIETNILEKSCGSYEPYPYPCFSYDSVNQESGSGEYYFVEQQRLEPCQPAPVRCEICFDLPEQTGNEGKNYLPEQTRKGC